MSLDRAELAGTGAAIAFHVALIAALSLSLAHVARAPEPPPMEVEIVDEVGLQPAAAVAAPPPPSQAPDQAQTPPLPQPEPARAPQVEPTPQPKIAPATSLAAQIAQLRPTPPRRAAATPAQPRASRIGADFLRGIADSPSRASPTKPAAAVFDAVAKTSVSAAIKRQIQPCASRQPFIGDGANRIQLSLNLRLDRSGRLTQPPTILGVTGEDDDNSRYLDVVKDQARRVYADCSPLRLPAELYQTPSGGWSNITINYKVE